MAPLSCTAIVCNYLPCYTKSASHHFDIYFSSTNRAAFSSKRHARRIIFIRNSSGDVSSSETPTDVLEESTESSSDIEVPKGPPSLISALNVERALRGIPITDVDHYGRLGIQQNCSYEQVDVAYKQKVDEVLNRGLDEEDLRKEMELLRETYSILSCEEERRMYDWSLARTQKPDAYMWPYQVDKAKRPQEEPPFKDIEDVGPTRLVGYFFLAWIILSCILPIILYR